MGKTTNTKNHRNDAHANNIIYSLTNILVNVLPTIATYIFAFIDMIIVGFIKCFALDLKLHKYFNEK